VSKRCLYNRKGLKKAKICVCYSCFKEINKEDIPKTFLEELVCPECKQRTVLPLGNLSNITFYWLLKIKTP
jgi:hypothetical protein